MSDVIATDMVGQKVFMEKKEMGCVRVVYYGTEGLCVAVENSEGKFEDGIKFNLLSTRKKSCGVDMI